MKIKKTKSGDIVFEVTSDFSNLSLKKIIKFFLKIILGLFLPIFSFFDKLAEKRKLVISGVGLGIGLVLSIITTQRPDTLQAFPVLVGGSIIGIKAKSLKIPELDLYADIKYDNLNNFTKNITSDKLVHLEGSGFLGQNNPVVIADLSSKDLLGKIESIKIGEEIIVIGKNNGQYKYRVIEIRETETQYLPHVIAREENSLIVYKSQNLFRTRAFVVVAKPF